MISIIVCSINENFYNKLIVNIARTINVAYEIIKIENSVKNYGICKAYNIGAKKSKFPYLCFLHEDIEFKTEQWGTNLINLMSSDDEIGLIGVAGSTYKSYVPSTWSQGIYQTDYQNIIQHHRYNVIKVSSKTVNDCIQVKVLDGVFLFTKKEIWEKYKFDENSFDKFHCYDLDFSMQVGREFKILVYNKLLIEHFSAGSLNKDWVNYSIKLSEKWQKILPLGNLSKIERRKIEWRNRKIFFLRMNILKFPITTVLKYFLKYNFIKTTSIKDFMSFLLQIVGQKLKILTKKPLY